MATPMTKAEQRKRDATLLTIARDRMLMKDLTTTKSSADFHDTAVWCVKDALEAAYAAGMEAGLAKARRDAAPADHVADSEGCPRCGETHQDALVWQDDETIHCTNCGTRYDASRSN